MIERWPSGDQAPATSPHATALHGEGGVSEVVEAVIPDGAAPGPVAPVRPKKSMGRRVAWLLSMVTVGALLGTAIYWATKFIDGPVATNQGQTLAELRATPSAKPGLSLLGGQYVELKYPDKFNQVGRASGNSTTLEAYNLSSRTSYARQIAINVSKLPSNNLEDDSGYKFRIINPSEYTSKKVTLLGEPAVELHKTDKTEVTLYWAHKGMLLSVAATSADVSHDHLDEYLAVIEPTIRWKQ